MEFALWFLGILIVFLFWTSSKKKNGSNTIPIIRNLGPFELNQVIKELKSNGIRCFYKDEGSTGYFNATMGQGNRNFHIGSVSVRS